MNWVHAVSLTGPRQQRARRRAAGPSPVSLCQLRQPADRLGRRQQVRDQGSAVAPALAMSAARRHWHCDGTDPLPTGAEALDEPFSTFSSWFLRITCDRCGKDGLLPPRKPECGCTRHLGCELRNRPFGFFDG